MPRTVVISDLHIGAYAGHCVLERSENLDRLIGALTGVERLIILGDLLELGEHRPPEEVLAIAAPILSRLAAAVDEFVLIPGNHDRGLVQAWVATQGEALSLDAAVPTDASPLLIEVAGLLAGHGATVSVRYPGFFPSPRVWLTHGHYLDHALAPEGPLGLFVRSTPTRPAGYEGASHRHGPPSGVKAAQKILVRPEVTRLSSWLLDLQMRRHSLPALAHVAGALGIEADHIVFGHVHRLGPRPGDDPRRWSQPLRPGGPAVRFLNTGAWVWDSLLISDGRYPSHYFPGGAVELGEDGIPRAIRLLDDLARP